MSTLQTTILKHPDSASNNIQFDSSGNCGLKGVSSPATVLNLRSDSTDDGILLQKNDGTNVVRLFFDGTSNHGRLDMFSGGAATLQLRANGNSHFSGGNLGINTTSPQAQFVVSNSGAQGIEAGYSGGTSTNFIQAYNRSSSAFIQFDVVGNPLVFKSGSSATEAMRIDDSARVGVGTSSPITHFQTSINTPDAVGIMMENRADTGTDDKVGVAFGLRRIGGHLFHQTRIRAVKENAWTGTPTTINSQYRFNVMREESTQERLRIESTGSLRTFMVGSAGRFHLASNQGAGGTILLNCVHSRTGIDAGGTASLRIYTDGDVENTNNSYSVLSDEKLKENIVDANSQWDDIKALRVRNFNFKEETGIPTHTQIGVIAQEVELVSPGLVKVRPATTEEGEDLEEKVKSVNSSVLYMKAVKALQEAMDRIEQLEAKVAALEAG